MFDYTLALMTGVDIPIPELELVLKQPTIKEISMVGENQFFIGVQTLTIDKLTCIQDEEVQQRTTNFAVFITLLSQKEMASKKKAVQQVMSLLCPEYKCIFTPRSMVLNCGEKIVTINEENFEFLQECIRQQFCLTGSGQENFNPQGKKAKEIAQKIMKSRQRLAKQSSNSGTKSIFNQYLSTLTVGMSSMSLLDLINLTMYQLFDLVERYTLYMNWDIDIRSRMAGAKVDKPVEDWMRQIH